LKFNRKKHLDQVGLLNFDLHLFFFMKKILIVIIGVFLIDGSIFAQSQAEISRDPNGDKILKGLISRKELENDTSFAWWAENLKGYTPQSLAVAELRKDQNIQFITFMGTWCGDSKFIIPKFYSLLDTAGFPQDRVTLIGVDRNKKTLSHLAEELNIVNVPTIIVIKNGKEIGRVVEYGKNGLFDKELGEIIASIPASPAQ